MGTEQVVIPSDPESDCLMAYSGPDLSPVFSLAVAADIFLYGAHNGMIRGFYIEDPYTACELVGHRSFVRDLCLADDGTTLHSASKDGTVKTWDLTSKEELSSREVSSAGVECIRRLGGHVVCGTSDGAIAAWNATGDEAEQGAAALHLKVHVGNVASMAMHMPTTSQMQCFTVSHDGCAKHVDLTTGKLLAVYEGCGPLKCCTLDQDANVYYVGGSARHVLLYDVRCAACVGQFRGHTEAVTGVALHVPAAESQTAGEPEAGAAAAGMQLPRSSHAVLPQSQATTLYSSSDDCTVVQWNARTQTQEYVFRGHNKAVSCVQLTRAGQLFSGSYDSSVRIWDVDSARSAVQAWQTTEKQTKSRSDNASRDKSKDKSGSKKGKGKDKKKDKKSSSKKKSGKKGSKKKKK